MLRTRLPERMDQPGLDPRAHVHALRALNRINRWLGVDRDLYRALRPVGRAPSLSIVDLGTGGGGFLDYARRRRNGHDGDLWVGVDRSPFALVTARRWQNHAIRCVAADARSLPLADESVDVVTCSLFLHHFDEADVVRIMTEAARVARRGVVIGDLSRSYLALGLTWLTTRMTSRSRMFHIDGPRSVRAAFRPRELAVLVRRAGLHGARVRRRFPFRILVRWWKSGGENGSVV